MQQRPPHTPSDHSSHVSPSRTFFVAFAVGAALLSACSGASFDVGSRATDDAGIDSARADSAIDAPTDRGGDGAVDAPADRGGDTASEACAPNACGGCGALVGQPGDTCGGAACGEGTLVCDKSGKLACSAHGANPCGGCATLVNPPGTSCGACAKYVCSGMEATSCKDDSTLGVELAYSGTGASEALTTSNKLALAFTVQHSGRVADIRLTLSKKAAAIVKRGGAVYVTAYTGTPDSAKSTLGSGSVSLGSIGTSPTAVSFGLASSSATLNAGDPIFFEISTDAAGWSVNVFGGDPSVSPRPRDAMWWTTPSGTGYATESSFLPTVAVRVYGCFAP